MMWVVSSGRLVRLEVTAALCRRGSYLCPTGPQPMSCRPPVLASWPVRAAGTGVGRETVLEDGTVNSFYRIVMETLKSHYPGSDHRCVCGQQRDDWERRAADTKVLGDVLAGVPVGLHPLRRGNVVDFLHHAGAA